MDNNLNDQTTESSAGEGTNPSSYTDPNAGYTEAEPQTENGNDVPKEAADDNLKQKEEKEHPAYTYGEMPKSDPGSNYGQPEQGGSTYHSGASEETYENTAFNNNAYNGNSYQNGGYNGYSNNQYQNSGYNTGFNASGYHNNYNGQNNYQMPPKQLDPSPLSTGEWILTLIVGIIPCAGLILYIIWAFSNSGNLNRRNYCRASLILQVISYVLVIFFILIVVLGGSVSYYGY